MNPQLDSEELRQKLISLFEQNYLDGDKVQNGQMIAATEILDYLDEFVLPTLLQDRAAFADRVLAVVPEKIRQLCEERGQTLQPDMILVPLPIHQVTTAITNLVAEERGEKK